MLPASSTVGARPSASWESKAAFEAFRDERVVPAITTALGVVVAAGGPRPAEWFEVKHMLRGQAVE